MKEVITKWVQLGWGVSEELEGPGMRNSVVKDEEKNQQQIITVDYNKNNKRDSTKY